MSDYKQPLAISVGEAAELLGVSRSKLYELIHQDGFPSFRLGGRTLVSREGLAKWIAAQVAHQEG